MMFNTENNFPIQNKLPMNGDIQFLLNTKNDQQNERHFFLKNIKTILESSLLKSKSRCPGKKELAICEKYIDT